MAEDIVNLLKSDHLAAKALLQQFDTPAQSREEYFCEVVQTLVGHEVAEELVVYPALRRDPGGDSVAQARLAEQSEAEELLSDMESDDPASAEFSQKFIKLRDAVLAHAEAEEVTVFPLLEQSTTADQRAELGARYAKAKDRAPTHPHPHAPDTPPGNKLLGPVAALFDRVRDAVHQP
jgi:hemerythrin superfamily protein